jgi:hypothetical protein
VLRVVGEDDFYFMPLNMMTGICDCMLDGVLVFKDLSTEHSGYKLDLGYQNGLVYVIVCLMESLYLRI